MTQHINIVVRTLDTACSKKSHWGPSINRVKVRFIAAAPNISSINSNISSTSTSNGNGSNSSKNSNINNSNKLTTPDLHM